jgi:hypothetical protein
LIPVEFHNIALSLPGYAFSTSYTSAIPPFPGSRTIKWGDQMGRHPFSVALFIAHSDVFFHIPHFKVVRVL